MDSEVHRYTTCGLRLLCSHPLTGLLPDRSDTLVDPVPLEIRLAESPPIDTGPWSRVLDGSVVDDHGRPLLVIDAAETETPGRLYRFSYSDGTEFWLLADGRKVWAQWPASSSLQNTSIYLNGPVLGLALRLRGLLPIHASSVVVDGRAVLFVGPPQAGKSTTAAAFALAGFRVLADDTSVIHRSSDGGFEVSPDGFRLRLWPESAELLFGKQNTLPRLTPDWSKRGFDLGQGSIQAGPVQLAALYFLDGEPGLDESVGSLRASPVESVVRLAANLAVPGFPDRSMRARELDTLSELVASVPVRRWIRPRGDHVPSRLIEAVRSELDLRSGRS